MSYDTYWLCTCGDYGRMPFGMWEHVHKTVCPRCGEPMPGPTTRKVVAREVGFWYPRLVMKDDEDKAAER